MKQRSVNTEIWNDGWFQELEPNEKLLFSFFLTNPATNVAGIYEVTVKTMAFMTGIEKDEITKILQRFRDIEKVFHENGTIIMVNHLRHQKLNLNMQKGVTSIIQSLKPCIKETNGFKLYLKIYNTTIITDLP